MWHRHAPSVTAYQETAVVNQPIHFIYAYFPLFYLLLHTVCYTFQLNGNVFTNADNSDSKLSLHLNSSRSIFEREVGAAVYAIKYN